MHFVPSWRRVSFVSFLSVLKLVSCHGSCLVVALLLQLLLSPHRRVEKLVLGTRVRIYIELYV